MIRKYSHQDKPEVIELLRLNTPEYFDSSEEEDLINYLDKEIEDYYVVVENSKIVGAGGINYFLPEKTARISWDMIKPNSQGKGIGMQLIKHRIDRIKENNSIENIIVRTSQHAYRFYEKTGFKLKKIEKDYWAKGFDLYIMSMKNMR